MEVKHSGKSMEQRIHDRLKPSGGQDCGDGRVTKGEGPTRTITTVHHSGGQHSLKHTADEQREAAPHDFGISGSPLTMEVFPVSGETSKVQTLLPWRTVTCARSA